ADALSQRPVLEPPFEGIKTAGIKTQSIEAGSIEVEGIETPPTSVASLWGMRQVPAQAVTQITGTDIAAPEIDINEITSSIPTHSRSVESELLEQIEQPAATQVNQPL
ncbi:hypothetical protein KC220_21620, partial [Mycobacterium tuberculosis]|nr:hypothetical protein [Mycobacterium tuberculosis]